MIARKKFRRCCVILLALVVVAFVALNVLAYRHAHAMIHYVAKGQRTAKPEKLGVLGKGSVLFRGVTLPRPETTQEPSSLHLQCKALKIEGTNGITLGAWYCEIGQDRPLVILFHGYGGEKSGTTREARAFLEMGMSVLLVDFRGSGESSESYTTIGYDEGEDVVTAVRYAHQLQTNRKVYLYGQSMGAAAIFRAIQTAELRPDGIISEAVFDRLLTTVRHRFAAMGVPSFPSAELLVFWGGRQAGFDGFAHNPMDYARKVDCPILFLHGAHDPRAHIVDARRVFDAVPGPKRFHEFAAIGHEPAIVRFPDEWKNAVREWLREME